MRASGGAWRWHAWSPAPGGAEAPAAAGSGAGRRGLSLAARPCPLAHAGAASCSGRGGERGGCWASSEGDWGFRGVYGGGGVGFGVWNPSFAALWGLHPLFPSRIWGAGSHSPSAAPIAGPIFFPPPQKKTNTTPCSTRSPARQAMQHPRIRLQRAPLLLR